jgi:hypothetical protein
MLDAFSDWWERDHMSDLTKDDVAGMMRFWYEQVVDEQKKVLREYKKKAKSQTQLQIEPVLTIASIKEDQAQKDNLEPIEA